MSFFSFNLGSNYWSLLLIIAILIFIIFSLQKKKNIFFNNLNVGIPILEQYSQDLTQNAIDGKLDPVIGRKEEIERVIQVLCRRTKNNPVLVGKAGVGKTAIAEGLAQLIADKKVPQNLTNKRVLALDLPSLISGTKYRGEFEQRLKKITQEITAAHRNIILFIDEIHILSGAGGVEGAIDADDILKPALAKGDLQVIGATTVAEYKKFIKNDVTLDRRLHPILVDEPTRQETIDILRGIKKKYETFHRVNITDDAIIAAVDLTEKFIKNKSFPDKAIDLLDETASKANIESMGRADKSKLPPVGKKEIQLVMREWKENKII